MNRIAVLAGAAALTVGLIAGGGVGYVMGDDASDPKNSTEYKALADELEIAKSDILTFRDQVKDVQADLAAAKKDIPAREKALESREADLEFRESMVEDAEEDAEDNTFDDGVYEVGSDIKPGTYKTTGSGESCYYAKLRSPDTTDIISNNNTEGPAVVTVSKGQYFTSARCGEWKRQ